MKDSTTAPNPIEIPSSTTDISPITREVLLDRELPAPRRTAHVEIRRITIAPNTPAGPHIHNCPVFGNVEIGSVVFQIDGEPEVILGPGDTFYEPEGVRIARFDARSEGVTFLGYFLLDTGETPELAFPEN